MSDHVHEWIISGIEPSIGAAFFLCETCGETTSWHEPTKEGK